MQKNGIPDDVKFVIHANEKAMPGHIRKCNVPEASEVAALIVGQQHGKIDIALRRRSEYDANGFGKLNSINLSHRMYGPLAYPLLFPYVKDGWHIMVKHNDSRGNLQKFSPKKFHSRLLFESISDFNPLLNYGRLFQQYLCEMFIKVETERISWLRHNQSMLRASDYTHLCELLANAASNKKEVNERTGNTEQNSALNVGSLVVFASFYIGSDRYIRQKMHDIIAVSNSLLDPDIFLTMTCKPEWPEIENALLLEQRAYDRPELCDRVFRMKLKLLLKHLKEDKPLRQFAAFVSVIEYQKRGLVHAQISIFLDQEAKFSLQDPTNINRPIQLEFLLLLLLTCKSWCPNI